MIGLAGLDPMEFLNTRDPLARNFMVKVADRINQQREIEQRNLATRIVNGVGKLLGG